MYELERTVFQELFRRVLDNQYQVTPEERKALVQCDNSIVRRGIFSALTSFSLIYYGLKQFQKTFQRFELFEASSRNTSHSIRFNHWILLWKNCCTRELYEQSPSSTTGQTIATRYGFLLDSTTVPMKISDVGFGDNENSDWKEVDTWQSDNSIYQGTVQKRMLLANSTSSLPSNETDYGFASLPGYSSSQSDSDVLESWDIGNDNQQENTNNEPNVKKESHRRRRRNEFRKSNGQVKSLESDPTEQGTIQTDTKDLLSSRQDTDALWDSSFSGKGSSATAF
ncbi:hypothetical protein Gasu2_53720 [Galdieria sulphuraria]|nr:hypothetical protein Gasu2_53720 [Galdieria sulphuraria]